jgi:hypothetical protein
VLETTATVSDTATVALSSPTRPAVLSPTVQLTVATTEPPTTVPSAVPTVVAPTATPTAGVARSTVSSSITTQLGFVWANGDLDADLATTNGNIYVIFGRELDPSRYHIDRQRGNLAIRVLRYDRKCPKVVGHNCNTTFAELGAFAAKYPGLTWETSNEPGIPGQDSHDSGFVTWQNAAYDAIKQADPAATVEGPGVFNWHGAGWPAFPLGSEIYRSGVKFDRIALHVYPQDTCMGPNWLPQAKAQVDGALALGYPVDITEMGDWWPQCAGWGFRTPSAETRQTNVAAFVAYAKARGISRLVWFQNRQAGTWPYGGTGWLVEGDGSLSPEGKAWVSS